MRQIVLILRAFCLLLPLVTAVAGQNRIVESHPKYPFPKDAQIYGEQYVEDIMRLSKSAEMRNFMNNQTNPCGDFYAFACGAWKANNPAHITNSLTTGLFETMSNGLDHKVTDLLSGTDTKFNYTTIDRKVQKFYASCLKLGELTDSYPEKLYALIEEFGQMPALAGDDWDERFNWLETVAKISRKYGQDIIFSIDIMADFRNNSVNRVYLGHADLPLESRSMYLDNATRVYRDIFKKKISSQLQKFLRLNKTLADITAKEIIDFQVALAHGMVDDSLGLDIEELSKLTTVDEMQKKYAPILDIQQLMNITLGETIEDEIYEYVDSFQENLMRIIPKTPKRILANYIFYTMLDDFLLDVESKPEKQKKLCIEKTKTYFAKNVDNMVYRKYATKRLEEDIEKLWIDITRAFKETLESPDITWIDAGTLTRANRKLQSLRLEINSYKEHNFTEEFGDLVVNDYDYFENVQNVLESSAKRAFGSLHEPPKPLEAGEILSYTPANILIENVIKVPVSLLQPYYLWYDFYPNALKYGTLGSLLGHELIHAFDDMGRKFDEHGNTKDWWDKASAKAFDERTRCFSEQYSKYVYDGHLLPMSVAQSENIADNGGLRLAYKAYLRWYADKVLSKRDDVLQNEMLPKMNYTGKQMFFISFAQLWCNDVHAQVKRLQTSTDQHMPGEFRVIGAVSNFDEFAKEFSCAKGTQMNPKKKCVIY